MKQPSAPSNAKADGASLELYNPKNVLVVPGKPDRFAFRRVSNGKVVLQYVSLKGKRYGSLLIPAAKFERDYIVAMTAHQRAIFRTKLLVAIHTRKPPPKDTPNRVLRTSRKWLKSNGLIQACPIDSWRTTEKGAKAAEQMIDLTTQIEADAAQPTPALDPEATPDV